MDSEERLEPGTGGLSQAGWNGVTRLKMPDRSRFQDAGRLKSVLKWQKADIGSGRFRVMLYRFLTENVPVINACVWTWARLSSAPGEFTVTECDSESVKEASRMRLDRLCRGLSSGALDTRTGLASLMPRLFAGLFRDGCFGGFLAIHRDGSGVDRFFPVDAINLVRADQGAGTKYVLDLDGREVNLDRPDFYLIPLANNSVDSLGGSILQAVPFVSYIEQQLVDDMRRASHNAGFHRLHVKITPPGRMSGESDSAYTDRINGYFDDTVDMIRGCEVDDNPVTWDNVGIEYIGPSSARDVSNSWFMNHRAMIEDVCAGTNLSPYLLGYSYGATTTWSAFKFDVVMRQVRSVQAEVAQFLEWIGNIDLALAGLNARCRFVFDNTFAYQALDKVSIESSRVDNVLKLYNAGLIDEEAARDRAKDLL